jgi:hypothetical protein
MYHLTKKRASAAVAAVVLCALFLGLSASVAFASDTPTRTPEQIQARWSELKPTYSGSPYAAAPSVHAPYTTGQVSSGFLADGLNMLNYCRYLAGLADDVSLDATYTDYAQHGAVLLSAAGFSHTPSKPADMDQTFYSLGYKGTSSGNIGMGHESLESFVGECMDDADPYNIDRLGHRRWFLNPKMAKTGLGYADWCSDAYVFDLTRTAPEWDAVRWPAAGAFPTEMANNYTPWSVTLNTAIYTVQSGTAGYQVTLRRTRDGKTWTFTSADTNKSGEYFNVETSGYGVRNCIIFRPDPSSVGGYLPGDTFAVTITGPIKRIADGSPVTITYETEFVSQNGPASSMRLGGKASVKRKRTYTLTGSVAPSPASGTVRITLSRYYRHRWHSAGAKTVPVSNGSFRFSFKPKYKGNWRATARFDGMTTASLAVTQSSATKGFKVK